MDFNAGSSVGRRWAEPSAASGQLHGRHWAGSHGRRQRATSRAPRAKLRFAAAALADASGTARRSWHMHRSCERGRQGSNGHWSHRIASRWRIPVRCTGCLSECDSIRRADRSARECIDAQQEPFPDTTAVGSATVMGGLPGHLGSASYSKAYPPTRIWRISGTASLSPSRCLSPSGPLLRSQTALRAASDQWRLSSPHPATDSSLGSVRSSLQDLQASQASPDAVQSKQGQNDMTDHQLLSSSFHSGPARRSCARKADLMRTALASRRCARLPKAVR